MWDARVTGLFLFWGQLKEEFFFFYCFTREMDMCCCGIWHENCSILKMTVFNI